MLGGLARVLVAAGTVDPDATAIGTAMTETASKTRATTTATAHRFRHGN